MSEKFAWILNPLSSWDETKEMITTSLESGIDHIVNFSSENNENIRKLGNINIVSNSEDSDIYLVGISSEGDGTLELDENLDKSKDLAEAKKFKNLNKPVCAYIEITDKNHEQLAVKLGDYCDYLILVGKDWTVIPLENIIADLQTKDVKLIAAVESVEDAKVAIETLEVGTDGVIFEPKDFNQIKEISKLIENLSQETYSLKDATVTNVTPLGSGDRVCIDTTAIMEPGEGMLIGSYSKAMIFVHSESLESEYVASRPFRVNAGPVQALIVNTDGETRKAYVGRSKIEKRPLLLIEAEYEDVKIKTLVQNAETIRVVDNEGKPLSVADLKKGDKIKVFIDQKARHFGMSIDENIIEK